MAADSFARASIETVNNEFMKKKKKKDSRNVFYINPASSEERHKSSLTVTRVTPPAGARSFSIQFGAARRQEANQHGHIRSSAISEAPSTSTADPWTYSGPDS